MSTLRKLFLLLLIALMTQGCLRARLNVPADRISTDVESTATDLPARMTSTPRPTQTVVPTALEFSPTPLPRVTITAVNGNLYIRRGPGLEYNPILLLKRGMSAEVIASDVLGIWVQVIIPNSIEKGWVSVQTEFSKIAGDLSSLPDFTYTEWPVPAYIKNCTEHDMFIIPGDIYLPSLYTNAEYKNEVQVNPGTYTAYDLFVAGEPEAEKVEIREGTQAYITMNGLGVKHKCP